MKSILRSLFVNALVLYLAARIFPGIAYNGQFKTLILAALALTLLNLIIRPVIKLLLLPINLITLNLFGWIVNVIMLFLVTVVVKGYQVVPFHFLGYSNAGFIIPAMDISLLVSYILASIVISALVSLLIWLLKG